MGHASDTCRIVVLGVRSGSGKTCLAVGLCRLLAQRGLHTLPFKAVAIGPDPLAHHRAAAGVEPSRELTPLTVEAVDGNRGVLHVLGASVAEVKFVDDLLDLGQLDARVRERAIRVTREAFATVSRSADAVVVEGAGSAAALPAERDVANAGVTLWTSAAVVLVASAVLPDLPTALARVRDALPPEVVGRLRGVVVNGLDPADATATLGAVTAALGVQPLAAIPTTDLFAAGGPVGDPLYEKWATFVDMHAPAVVELVATGRADRRPPDSEPGPPEPRRLAKANPW